MTDDPISSPELQPLHDLAELREQPFRSDVPLIGGLITWFRSAWNSVATKWYVRPMMAQQTTYNQAVLAYLEQLDARRHELDLLVADLERRIAAQDREKTHLVHELGETTARIIQLQAALRAHEDQPPGDRPS